MKLIKSYRVKFFILFIIFGLLVNIFALFAYYQINKSSIVKEFQKNAAEEFAVKRNDFLRNIDRISNTVKSLSGNNLFETFKSTLDYDKGFKKKTSEILTNVMKANPDFMQLRFLNIDGLEIVRINRDSINGQPWQVAEENLQDKSSRYYFIRACSMDSCGLWFSKIDLNLEHGEYEMPLKPILRAISPVVFDSTRIGYIVINVFMQNILSELQSSSIYHVSLIDKEGYYLLHKDPALNWSRYLSVVGNAAEICEEVLKLQNDDELICNDYYYIRCLGFNNDDDLRIVFEIMPEGLEYAHTEFIKSILLLFLAIIVISLPVSYWISIIPDKLNKRILEQNEKNEELNALLQQKVVEIKRMSEIDHLTRINNRLKFENVFEVEFARSKRYKNSLSLVMFDIDYFKKINDTYGHIAGDAILKELSELITLNIRKTDSFARWGGEEFILLLPETSLSSATVLAENLRLMIYTTKFSNVKRLSCSFGVTQLKEEDTMETFIQRTDSYLYIAKKSGRNRVYSK